MQSTKQMYSMVTDLIFYKIYIGRHNVMYTKLSGHRRLFTLSLGEVCFAFTDHVNTFEIDMNIKKHPAYKKVHHKTSYMMRNLFLS